MKSSSLAYNQRGTRDKRMLDRDPDRSRCHLHNSLKFFGRGPWLYGHRQEVKMETECHRGMIANDITVHSNKQGTDFDDLKIL